MWQIHCDISRPNELINCLSQHKDEVDFEAKCRKVILDKEVVQAKGLCFYCDEREATKSQFQSGLFFPIGDVLCETDTFSSVALLLTVKCLRWCDRLVS